MSVNRCVLSLSTLVGFVIQAASGSSHAESLATSPPNTPDIATEPQAQPSPPDSSPEASPPAPVFMPSPPPSQSLPVAQEPEHSADTGYGHEHSMHLGLSFGIGGGSGGTRYAGGAGFGYFVVTGVAPGVDLNVNGGSGVLTTTALTGTLRLVPIRTDKISVFLIGRAGRLFISSHSDVWAAGGGAGVVVPVGDRAGLLASYEALGLWPSSRCSDLANRCRLDSFGLGLIFGL